MLIVVLEGDLDLNAYVLLKCQIFCQNEWRSMKSSYLILLVGQDFLLLKVMLDLYNLDFYHYCIWQSAKEVLNIRFAAKIPRTILSISDFINHTYSTTTIVNILTMQLLRKIPIRTLFIQYDNGTYCFCLCSIRWIFQLNQCLKFICMTKRRKWSNGEHFRLPFFVKVIIFSTVPNLLKI